MNIAGKVVAITGGARGIGRALARRFAREGARHVAVADRDGAGARAVAADRDRWIAGMNRLHQRYAATRSGSP